MSHRSTRNESTYHMVADNVVVALLGEEFDGEAVYITHGICATLLTTGGTGAEKHLGGLANSVEELGVGEVGDVLGDAEFTPGTITLGVNNSVE